MLNIRREYARLVKDTIDYIGTGFGTEPEAPTVPPKKKIMADLTGEILQCTCCGLHRGRSRAVPGEGSIDADILFVGEGPGQVEDSTGRPFVGKAGQLLTKMLAAIDLTREEVYITNIVKCRPPGNRNPLPEEIEKCMPYLERQIALIDPLIICCLGGPASGTLLSSGVGISKLRGTIHRYEALTGRRPGDGVPLVATYHPAAVLRFPEKYRRPVWNDLKLLRDYYRDIKEKR